MKKIIIFILILAFNCLVEAHNQHVHQYITKEGYYLLKNSLNADIGEMLARLDNGPVGPSWSNGTIAAGTWLEDEIDVIYGYNKSNPPTLTGIAGSAYDFTTIFGGLTPDGFVSSTHFW